MQIWRWDRSDGGHRESRLASPPAGCSDRRDRLRSALSPGRLTSPYEPVIDRFQRGDGMSCRLVGRERAFLTGMGLVLGLRQFVLLLPLPIVAVYAIRLEGGSPASAGLALGIFGLLQALLQIPFGRA